MAPAGRVSLPVAGWQSPFAPPLGGVALRSRGAAAPPGRTPRLWDHHPEGLLRTDRI